MIKRPGSILERLTKRMRNGSGWSPSSWHQCLELVICFDERYQRASSTVWSERSNQLLMQKRSASSTVWSERSNQLLMLKRSVSSTVWLERTNQLLTLKRCASSTVQSERSDQLLTLKRSASSTASQNPQILMAD